MSKRYGKIEEGETFEKTYEEREIEWKVKDISYVIYCRDLCYNSPSFCFAGNSWHFQLIPESAEKKAFMTLYLCKENTIENDCSIYFTYSVKKLDGCVEHFGEVFFKESYLKFSEPCYFLQLEELEERKSELAPSDVLTLTCILRREIPNSQQPSALEIPNSQQPSALEIPNSQQPSALDKPNLKKLIKLDTLSKNFKDLFANKESCDTTLHVKDRAYRVHRAVMITRSSVFAAMFLHDTKEKQTSIVNIPDCDPETFGEFLEFLYCGKLEKFSICSALHLYVTSDKYDVQELKAFCIEYMIENLTVTNLCDVVICADKYDDVKLSSAAQSFFNKNSSKIFQTSEWECFVKDNFGLAKKLWMEMPKKF